MFCASAEILEEWVKKNNGVVAVPSLKIDGYPTGFEEIGAWLDSLIN
jgi:glutaredoxin